MTQSSSKGVDANNLGKSKDNLFVVPIENFYLFYFFFFFYTIQQLLNLSSVSNIQSVENMDVHYFAMISIKSVSSFAFFALCLTFSARKLITILYLLVSEYLHAILQLICLSLEKKTQNCVIIFAFSWTTNSLLKMQQSSK